MLIGGYLPALDKTIRAQESFADVDNICLLFFTAILGKETLVQPYAASSARFVQKIVL